MAAVCLCFSASRKGVWKVRGLNRVAAMRIWANRSSLLERLSGMILILLISFGMDQCIFSKLNPCIRQGWLLCLWVQTKLGIVPTLSQNLQKEARDSTPTIWLTRTGQTMNPTYAARLRPRCIQCRGAESESIRYMPTYPKPLRSHHLQSRLGTYSISGHLCNCDPRIRGRWSRANAEGVEEQSRALLNKASLRART